MQRPDTILHRLIYLDRKLYVLEDKVKYLTYIKKENDDQEDSGDDDEGYDDGDVYIMKELNEYVSGDENTLAVYNFSIDGKFESPISYKSEIFTTIVNNIETQLDTSLTEEEKAAFYDENYKRIKLVNKNNQITVYIPCLSQENGEQLISKYKSNSYYIFPKTAIYADNNKVINTNNPQPGIYSNGGVFEFVAYDENSHYLILSSPFSGETSIHANAGTQYTGYYILQN